MDYNKGSHSVYDIKYHIIWVTKYRYKIISKPIGLRLRELIRQGCESRNMAIIKGNRERLCSSATVLPNNNCTE